MAKNIRIDRTRRLREEPQKGHNRWHPDIPPVIEVAPGEEVTLETRDAMDLQIGPRTTVQDPGEDGAHGGASTHGAGVREGREAGRPAGDRAPRHRAGALAARMPLGALDSPVG
jgi:hypothetical protein